MKIAYFDYWTKGIGNFTVLDSELRRRGHSTVLLHLASFNDPTPEREVVADIHCRDISSYGTRLIYRMLERERPDILITLNTTKLLDRVVTLSCRRLGIKSVFLMHGIRDLGSSNELLISLAEDSYNAFWKKMGRAGKYLRVVIPNYLCALAHARPSRIANLRFVKVIYSYFRNPGRSLYFPEYRDEIVNDVCLVYSKNDVKYYVALGYDHSRITVVGNPKYDSLNDSVKNSRFDVEMLPSRVREAIRAGGSYALYLEEGFPEQNEMAGVTDVVRDRLIVDCAERLKRENTLLVVKLHPVTDRDSIKATHPNLVIETGCLDPLIVFSKFCICCFSTTINNCVLAGKPVLMPQWIASEKMPSFFVDMRVSNPWNKLDDEFNTAIDLGARREYIENYITVVTPEAVQNVMRAIGA